MKQELLPFSLLYLIGFLLVLYCRKNELLVLGVLFMVFVIVAVFYSKRLNWTYVLLLTALFCAVENICVYYGLWTYNRTKYPMPYVPIWLYLAWCLSIIFILKLAL